MEDIHVSAEGVTKLLTGLKALGPDELHPRVLKELASKLSPMFAHLFQQSIDMHEIPKERSLANIYVTSTKKETDIWLGIIDQYL